MRWWKGLWTPEETRWQARDWEGQNLHIPYWNVRVWIGFGFLEFVQSKLERVHLIYIPWHAENALGTSAVQSQNLKVEIDLMNFFSVVFLHR